MRTRQELPYPYADYWFLSYACKLDITDKAVTNSLFAYVEISDMKRPDTLALFVKQDDNTCLLDARAETKKISKLRAALISSGGTVIDERCAWR